MTYQDKITAARAYIDAHGKTAEAINDAANIYAESYSEYIRIWDDIQR